MPHSIFTRESSAEPSSDSDIGHSVQCQKPSALSLSRTPLPATKPGLPAPTYPELRTLPSKVSPTAASIFQLPIQRELDLRPGKILKGLAGGRMNLEASLGQVRGSAPASGPCIRCARSWKPKGPFRSCIVVEGQFAGACCNCRYNNDGSGCDLHRLHTNPTAPKKPRNSSVKPRPSPPPRDTIRSQMVQRQLATIKRRQQSEGKSSNGS
ncbi:uncharacterized protein PAC_06605 [Phialocephala subalpina]|uniref:Uncharacterized protein n=1 Tax=Phialocephala subalpina TaxID=576137 RepID=A0A1L7WVB1_9HELO|nr:uncharacterized protein PAC_06605 [Phialocephala subalpina]